MSHKILHIVLEEYSKIFQLTPTSAVVSEKGRSQVSTWPCRLCKAEEAGCVEERGNYGNPGH
jgi:hypothetical protein